jgi:hypothetical protein
MQRRTILRFEELEDRAVPSSSSVLAPAAVTPSFAAAQPAAQPSNVHVFGVIQGTYTDLGHPGIDAGTSVSFKGSGAVDYLGAVSLTGSLQGTGNITFGQANGELTLTDGRGSVTLQLVGPTQGMFAPLPSHFAFSVVTGTGAYQGLTLTGEVDLVRHAVGKTFTLTFTALQAQDAGALAGSAAGAYQRTRLVGDTGASYTLTGTGAVGLLGAVSVAGSFQCTGFSLSGHATGQLTLSNAAGSVTLRLVGPEQGAFAPPPGQFTFTVEKGTGAYTDFRKSGVLELGLKPAGLALGTGVAALGDQGSFALTFHPSAASATTGIRGVVLEGPVAPVARPGVPNTRPVPGAVLSVRLADGITEVANVRADAQGMFHLSLTPGVYVIVPLPPDPGAVLPHGTLQKVSVTSGHVLDLTFVLDTGIR